MGTSFKTLIYATVLTSLFITIIAIYFGSNHWDFFKKNEIKTKNSFHDIVKFSLPLVITMMLTWLFQSFDRFAIKHWSTMNELGIYVAAFSVISMLTIVQSTFCTFWTPVALEHFEKSPKDKKFYSEMNQIVTLVMIVISVGTIMFKDIIILR